MNREPKPVMWSIRSRRRCELRCVGSGRTSRTRRGESLIDVLVVISCVVLLAVGWYWYDQHQQRGRRVQAQKITCLSNLRQIGMALSMYEVTHRGQFPLFPFAEPVGLETGAVTYAPGRIGKYRERYSTADDTDLSTTRALWLLFQKDLARQPEVFICPATSDVDPGLQDARSFFDFAAYGQISYGYQVPFGQKGRPSTKVRRSAEMVLSADQGPYGAAMEGGLPHPGPPAAVQGTVTDWTPWNSPNHLGRWNNVAFMDSHVESLPTPLVGGWQDNVYTRWEDASADAFEAGPKRKIGVPPTGEETPMDDADMLIYP